jgi:hypothetical protein
MPGFNISGAGTGADIAKDWPSNREDIARIHRFAIEKLGPIEEKDAKLLNFVKSISLPTVDFEIEEVKGAAINYKFAKTVLYGDVVVTFYDITGVLEKLVKWQSQVYNPDGGLGYSSPDTGYKQESRIIVTDGDGFELYNIKMFGSWPKQIQHADLTYESSDLKIVEITLACDYILHADFDAKTQPEPSKDSTPPGVNDKLQDLGQQYYDAAKEAQKKPDQTQEQDKDKGKDSEGGGGDFANTKAVLSGLKA